MSAFQARLNHRKSNFVETSKMQNFDYLFDLLLDVQGFLDDAALIRADLRTSTGFVEGSGVFTMVVAKLARVSKPVCSYAGD
jgi:hypothetical protein